MWDNLPHQKNVCVLKNLSFFKTNFFSYIYKQFFYFNYYNYIFSL